MEQHPPTFPRRLSRRDAVALGGVGAAGTAVALLATQARAPGPVLLEGIDVSNARELGEGFFEAEGWVLTSEDMKRLGGSLRDRTAREAP